MSVRLPGRLIIRFICLAVPYHVGVTTCGGFGQKNDVDFANFVSFAFPVSLHSFLKVCGIDIITGLPRRAVTKTKHVAVQIIYIFFLFMQFHFVTKVLQFYFCLQDFNTVEFVNKYLIIYFAIV